MTGNRARDIGVAAAIGATVFICSLALWEPLPVGSTQDDGLYVILAKSLATGQGFRFINLPDAPNAAHFPPGYPVFLAALWRIWPAFPANALLFGIANLALLAIAASGAFVLARSSEVGPMPAAVSALSGFLMLPALALGTTLLSEPLWLALAIPWLVWADRFARQTGYRDRVQWMPAAALGASAGALLLVRTQSLSLLVGMLAVLAMRKRWREAASALGASVLITLPWQLWVARHAPLIPDPLSGKYGAYGVWVAEGVREHGAGLFLDSALRNAAAALHLVAGMFSIPMLPAAIAIVTLLPAAIAGAYRLAARTPVVLATLCAHAGIILLFPGETQRYVWSSWPFMTIWLVAGFVELWQLAPSLKPRLTRPLTIALVTVVAAGAVIRTGIGLYIESFRNIASFGASQLEPAVEWVLGNAAPSAVIASDDETAVFLYTGRRAVPLTVPLASSHVREGTPNPAALGVVLSRYRPDFVIARWTTTLEEAARLSRGPAPLLRPVARLRAGAVFARTSGDR